MVRLSGLLATAGLLAHTAMAALPALDVEDPESIKKVAKLVAEDLFSLYPGRNTPGWTIGILPGPPPAGPYYWWQGGAMWGAFLDYRHHTGDESYDKYITESIVNQAGAEKDFKPQNWSASMGNDDQSFWALTAMLAAENKFPDPAGNTDVDYTALVQAVFNEQSDPERRAPKDGPCKGALRWQVYSYNNGFDYINTIANACYFNIGARLARYTANDTYSKLAGETYDIIKELGYISDTYDVYDGAHLPQQCNNIEKSQFSYNAALLMQGLAFLWAIDGDSKWETELNSLLDESLRVFFPGGIAWEPSCETGVCNTDMMSYKGYLHRWLGSVMQMAPFTKDKILPKLKTSAAAAVQTCTGGDNGRMCGFKWRGKTFDGTTGAGQEMNTLGALMSILMVNNAKPVTLDTGGTSQGNADAGTSSGNSPFEYGPIYTADKAGAGILTVLIIAATGSAFAWIGMD